MTEHPGLAERPPDESGTTPSFSWEVPEILGLAILGSIAILIVGGLVSGIARDAATSGGGFQFGNQQTWAAVQFGAQWATPVAAVFLVGVLGLCWWQVQGWSEVVEAPDDDDDDDLSEAFSHFRRARRLVTWTRVALALTALGSIAFFAAQVGQLQGSDSTLNIYPAANTVAVFAIISGAIWISRKLNFPPDPGAMSTVASR